MEAILILITIVDGQVSQGFSALSVLPEDQSLVPSAHSVWITSVTPAPGIECCLLASEGICTHVSYTHTFSK